MGTISAEQLLESVELDFTPKYIIKNEDGDICICSMKPEIVDEYTSHWTNYGEYIVLEQLRLTEFVGKEWYDCIYEVPRKTTGKIEKLKIHETSSGGNDMVLHVQKTPATPYEMHHKINELINIVNKHADIIQQIGDWGTRKGECLWCEKLTSVNLGK